MLIISKVHYIRTTGKSFVPLAFLMLLLSAMLQPNLSNRKAFAAASDGDDIWYLGKGIEKDMYIKFKIQSNSTDGNRPFNMTLYFSGFDNTLLQWNASMYVKNYQGQSEQAVFQLSDKNLSVTPTKVPVGIDAYLQSYQSAIDWKADYFSKPGIDLTVLTLDWKTGRIPSNAEVRPIAEEVLSVPAGNFSAIVLLSHQNGVDSKAWVSKDFSYPIKGEITQTAVCARVTNCPTAFTYKYELLAFGQGQPPFTVPEFLINSLMLVAAIALFAVVITVNKFQRSFGFASTP
jgi:hypothetical protein